MKIEPTSKVGTSKLQLAQTALIIEFCVRHKIPQL